VAFSEDDLADDEQAVVNTRPHWSRLTVPVLTVPVVLLLAVVGVFLVPAWPVQDAIQYLIIALAVGILAYRSVQPLLLWVTTNYVVTTRRLIIVEGVVHRYRHDIPLRRIEGLSVTNTAIERLFGCGTLFVSSRGARVLELLGVPNVEDVQATLYDLAEVATRRRRGGY
jgi:membrane protein YdbS with pleckstrin-like domain